jgi:hypothetical protein
MKYDDASWHYGGDYPKDLPSEAAATHIGMFLAWAILRDLVGDLHREDSQASLEKVRTRHMTGREFLLKECDEKFTDEDLSELGNEFALSYYEQTYLTDYCDTLVEGDTAYHVADTWENFARLAKVLDRRLAEWQRGHRN